MATTVPALITTFWIPAVSVGRGSVSAKHATILGGTKEGALYVAALHVWNAHSLEPGWHHIILQLSAKTWL